PSRGRGARSCGARRSLGRYVTKRSSPAGQGVLSYVAHEITSSAGVPVYEDAGRGRRRTCDALTIRSRSCSRPDVRYSLAAILRRNSFSSIGVVVLHACAEGFLARVVLW